MRSCGVILPRPCRFESRFASPCSRVNKKPDPSNIAKSSYDMSALSRDILPPCKFCLKRFEIFHACHGSTKAQQHARPKSRVWHYASVAGLTLFIRCAVGGRTSCPQDSGNAEISIVDLCYLDLHCRSWLAVLHASAVQDGWGPGLWPTSLRVAQVVSICYELS